MKQNKYLITCHCCGEQRWMTADQRKELEWRFYKVEHNTLVSIRTFYMHDHERAEKRLATEWKMTLDEFKACRSD